MARRVFISYQHSDQMKAKGLNLLTYNKNLNVNFTGRHLLDPVNSSNSAYIGSKIREQIKGSSATIVLIGSNTADSEWVAKEIAWSVEKGNGIIGIRIDSGADVPAALVEAGAEIIDWFKPADVKEFDSAIERAIAGTRRAKNMPLNSVTTCRRI